MWGIEANLTPGDFSGETLYHCKFETQHMMITFAKIGSFLGIDTFTKK